VTVAKEVWLWLRRSCGKLEASAAQKAHTRTGHLCWVGECGARVGRQEGRGDAGGARGECRGAVEREGGAVLWGSGVRGRDSGATV